MEVTSANPACSPSVLKRCVASYYSATVRCCARLLFVHLSPPGLDLYSISYTFVSGGAAGLLLTFCFYLVDIKRRGSYLWSGFMYLGMNAITMYLCAEGGIIEWFLSRFWLDDPDKNLTNILYPTGVYWGDSDDVPDKPSHNYQV
jgi:hypothetical protein